MIQKDHQWLTYRQLCLDARLDHHSMAPMNMLRAGHGWICGFLAGNGIYAVALNILNILQFFSCKSIKN